MDRFRDGLRRFWSELNTPDDFARDPVRGLTNQAGHILIGLALHGAVLAGTATLGLGPLPPVWATALCMTALYLVWIELRAQDWNGNDTIADTIFFSIGAAFWWAVLRFTPSQEWVRWPEAALWFLIWLAVGVVALAAYAAPRIWPPED